MTLLNSSLNISLRNHEFSKKITGEGRKRGIKDYGELYITKFDIVDPFEKGDTIWNEKKIRERNQRIVNDILNIWPATPN
jgi:hypothetical protein